MGDWFGRVRPHAHLLGYAAALGLGAFALHWIEYQYLTRVWSLEIITVLIAVGTLALGVWLGRRLTPSRAPAPFERNDAALRELGITDREFGVLEQVVAGRSNKEIARSLGVSPNTVKSHLSRLFTKLGVASRTQAIAQARSFRLIP